MQAIWGWAVAALGVSAMAGVIDWRDTRRRDYDRPALMPWTLIQLGALLVAIALAAVALI